MSNRLQVATPWYVGNNFQDAPPGHRYLLYLEFWDNEWKAPKSKNEALRELCGLPEHTKRVMHSLIERQRYIASLLNAEVVEAVTTSPFATGLGWEHPCENGFAFLQPYGIPYLAGSGVKGILRRSAEELALFYGSDSETEWTILDVWWLFGFEGDPGAIWGEKKDDNRWHEAFEQHKSRILNCPDLDNFLKKVLKNINIAILEKSIEGLLNLLKKKRHDISWAGALRFFDVIPDMPEMGVDIMNPHYGDYYQKLSTPHDASSPIPIFFLVIPPDSKFTFIVDCPGEHMLPEFLQKKWRTLIHRAFKHAFDWLGFGAKTAAGYGAMEIVPSKTDIETENTAIEHTTSEKSKKSKIEELVSKLSQCRGPGDKHILERILNEAESILSSDDKKVFFEQMIQKLPGSMKNNKKIKALLKEKRGSFCG